MKKIDTSKSLIFDKKIDNLKSSLEHIGEEGYFSNNDFSVYIKGTLKSVIVTDRVDCPYINKYDSHCFDYFIPKSKVVFVEEPKKLRPFKNIDEFSNETGCEELGKDFVTIKNKNSGLVSVLLYTGYSDDIVCLGGYIFTFADLLKNYEFLIDEWQTFGVENED